MTEIQKKEVSFDYLWQKNLHGVFVGRIIPPDADTNFAFVISTKKAKRLQGVTLRMPELTLTVELIIQDTLLNDFPKAKRRRVNEVIGHDIGLDGDVIGLALRGVVEVETDEGSVVQHH